MATEAAEAHAGSPSVEETLIRLFSGMWAMQTIACAARLEIPDRVAAGKRTARDIAASAGTNPDATSRLLRALANLGVLEARGNGEFHLTAVGERLRKGAPGTFRDAFIAETDELHWRSWSRLEDAVRTGAPRPQAIFGTPAFDYYGKHPADGEQFGRAMENLSRLAAAAVLEVYDFSGARTILDVGGGNGSLVLSILERHPSIRGMVLDLPYIEAHANERIAASPASSRCRFASGDFFASVPQGADVHLLKFILHDWTDDECVRLLRRCREAIAPEGRVAIVETIVPEDNRPALVHLMDLNMLVMTGGRERTASEYGKLLADSGFRMTGVIPTASPFSIVEARPV